jgi:hypothetical protein
VIAYRAQEKLKGSGQMAVPSTPPKQPVSHRHA